MWQIAMLDYQRVHNYLILVGGCPNGGFWPRGLSLLAPLRTRWTVKWVCLKMGSTPKMTILLGTWLWTSGLEVPDFETNPSTQGCCQVCPSSSKATQRQFKAVPGSRRKPLHSMVEKIGVNEPWEDGRDGLKSGELLSMLVLLVTMWDSIGLLFLISTTLQRCFMISFWIFWCDFSFVVECGFSSVPYVVNKFE